MPLRAGVPESTAVTGSNAMPGGRPEILQRYGGFPPVVTSVMLYAAPATPLGKVAVTMDSDETEVAVIVNTTAFVRGLVELDTLTNTSPGTANKFAGMFTFN
jgi:hypothetical protein